MRLLTALFVLFDLCQIMTVVVGTAHVWISGIMSQGMPGWVVVATGLGTAALVLQSFAVAGPAAARIKRAVRGY